MESVKKALEKGTLARMRNEQKAAGFFDGRFRSRTQTDRKKEAARRGCKNFKLTH